MQKTTKLLLVIGAVALFLLSTCVDDWPHYSVTLNGGYTTESGWIPTRGTWGEQAHIPLSHNSELTVRSICYPRESEGNQHCHLVVRVESQTPINAEIDEKQIIARDPANHDQHYVTRISLPRGYPQSNSTNPISIGVFLDYSEPPREFELLIPNIVVNGSTHAIPSIRFQYEDTFPYQLVPWFANF